MIDNELILEIRNKSDIVDIIGSYIPLSKKGKNYFGVCPFHDDTNPSMSVSKEKQIYTCFSCGATGNVITFVMDYEKMNYKESLQILATRLGIDLKIGTQTVVNEQPLKVYEAIDKFYQNNLNTSLGKNAKDYLKNRDISDDTIKEFGVGLSLNDKDKATKLLIDKGFKENELIELGLTNKNDYGYNDVFINRIMFPLWNETGHIVGYSGRIYENTDDAKYVNTKETAIFKKGLLLYNYHRAKEAVREAKSVIVMEGFMDVIRSHTIGIKNVVATMGTAVTTDQAKLIKKLSSNIYLLFDGDAAGEKATLACGDELVKLDVHPKIIRLEEGDPDTYILKYGVDKFNELFKNSISLMDFKIEYYKKDLDLNNNVDVSKYVRELMKEVSLIKDKILLELTLKRISSMVNVSYDTLKNIVNKDQQKELVINKPDSVSKKYVMGNKYLIAEKVVIYYMLTDEQIIIKYRNSIPYLPTATCRYLLQEIIDFYEKYKLINVADFITFLENKKELITAVGCVMEINVEEYPIEDIETHVSVLKEFPIQKEMNRLKTMLKEEINPTKKAGIAQKITDLKMRSEENVN